MATEIFAETSTIAGAEDDSVVELLLHGATTGAGIAIEGFRITALPTNGKLYLDQALTIEAPLNTLLPSATTTLPLYFKPDHNFNGSVDLKYVAVGEQSGGGVSNPSNYYLTVSGLDGGGTVRDHEGAFDVSGFTFDIEALAGRGQ